MDTHNGDMRFGVAETSERWYFVAAKQFSGYTFLMNVFLKKWAVSWK